MEKQHRFLLLEMIGVGLWATIFLAVCPRFILALAAPDAPVYWHPANTNLPTNNIETLAAAPLSSTILYAGTWEQGIYRSTDHGATWQPANTGITMPLRVQGGLAVNPVTPTILYAGDYYGNGGLYRSQNGGDSWTLNLPGAAVRDIAVHPLTPTIVLLADWQRGLYRSANAGDTWTPVTATVGFTATSARVLAFAPDVAYVGAANHVFSSGDAGQSWSLSGALPSSVQSLAVHPITPSIVYAGTLAHGLHRSQDGGITWDSLTNGLPPGAWITSLAFDPGEPLPPGSTLLPWDVTLYAGAWSGRVYRSADEGESWQDLGYLGYVYDVLVHPTAPSVIYAATSNNGVFRGSSLDHLTMAPVASPQHVHHSFPITLTAHDELGFPLTGTLRVQLAALAETDAALANTLDASGFEGAAILSDTTRTISPTLLVFGDGIAGAEVAIYAPVNSGTITAAVASGYGGTIVLPGDPMTTSNPFDVFYHPVASFAFESIPDQIAGLPFTITVSARDAWGVPTAYSGSNTLTDTTGTLTPLQAGPFVAGWWSGWVTVTQAGADVVVTTTNGMNLGASNPFAVAPNAVGRLLLQPHPMEDQIAGQPFILSVQVEDPFGNPALHYNGVLMLTDSTQTLLPVTATFDAGVWDGLAVIAQVQNDVVITAATNGVSVSSTPFDVLDSGFRLYLPVIVKAG